MIIDQRLLDALEASAEQGGVGMVLETIQHWSLRRADRTPVEGIRKALQDLGVQAYTVLDENAKALGDERMRQIALKAARKDA